MAALTVSTLVMHQWHGVGEVIAVGANGTRSVRFDAAGGDGTTYAYPPPQLHKLLEVDRASRAEHVGAY